MTAIVSRPMLWAYSGHLAFFSGKEELRGVVLVPDQEVRLTPPN